MYYSISGLFARQKVIGLGFLVPVLQLVVVESLVKFRNADKHLEKDNCPELFQSVLH